MKKYKNVLALVVAAAMTFSAVGCTIEDDGFAPTRRTDREDYKESEESEEVVDDTLEKANAFFEELGSALLLKMQDQEEDSCIELTDPEVLGKMTIDFDEGSDNVSFTYENEETERFTYTWLPEECLVEVEFCLEYENDLYISVFDSDEMKLGEVEATIIDMVTNPVNYDCVLYDGENTSDYDIEADILKLYARTVHFINIALSELNVSEFDFQFGTEYVNYDITELLDAEHHIYLEDHSFTNGVCTICNKEWARCLGEAIEQFDVDFQPEYGFASYEFEDTGILLEPSDYVQIDYYEDAGSELTQIAYVRNYEEDAEGPEISINLSFDLNTKLVTMEYGYSCDSITLEDRVIEDFSIFVEIICSPEHLVDICSRVVAGEMVGLITKDYEEAEISFYGTDLEEELLEEEEEITDDENIEEDEEIFEEEVEEEIEEYTEEIIEDDSDIEEEDYEMEEELDTSILHPVFAEIFAGSYTKIWDNFEVCLNEANMSFKDCGIVY